MLLNNVVQHCSGWVSALKVLTAYMADQRPLASHVTASKKKTAAQRAKSRNEFTTTTNHNQLSHNHNAADDDVPVNDMSPVSNGDLVLEWNRDSAMQLKSLHTTVQTSHGGHCWFHLPCFWHCFLESFL